MPVQTAPPVQHRSFMSGQPSTAVQAIVVDAASSSNDVPHD
jgi:hypothetical protein